MSTPNVLTILVDQLRYDACSHRGNTIVATPHIDRLASEGVVFTDATCSSPLCGPSRAALLSGCFAVDGAYRFANCEPDEAGPWNQSITTVDEALEAGGYTVAYQGKWHLGKEHLECYGERADIFGHHISAYRAYLATKYGEPIASEHQRLDQHYTGWPYHHMPVDEQMASATGKGLRMPHHQQAGVLDIADEDTLTAWTVRKTLDFLAASPTRPFATTCSILHPHAPLIASPHYARMFDPHAMPMPVNLQATREPNPPIPGAIPATPEGLGQYMALYYGLVKEVDDWVGRILDALDHAGLTENTLVIFTADHGELMGSHATLSKGKFYEECLRVPLLMRLPGRIPAGIRRHTPATGVSIAPTILDYCGLPPLELTHGQSLRAAIDGAGEQPEWAYSELGKRRCLRSHAWKYAPDEEFGAELYDLRDDPFEMHNLLDGEPTSAHRQQAEELERILADRAFLPRAPR